MQPEAFARPRSQLVDYFGEDRVSEKHLPDGRHVFRIAGVPLPAGCVPSSTPVLLVYTDPQGAPEVLVKPEIRLAGGKVPRNMNPLTVDGEPWSSFSANCPWNPSESVSIYMLRRIWRFRQPD